MLSALTKAKICAFLFGFMNEGNLEVLKALFEYQKEINLKQLDVPENSQNRISALLGIALVISGLVIPKLELLFEVVIFWFLLILMICYFLYTFYISRKHKEKQVLDSLGFKKMVSDNPETDPTYFFGAMIEALYEANQTNNKKLTDLNRFVLIFILIFFAWLICSMSFYVLSPEGYQSIIKALVSRVV